MSTILNTMAQEYVDLTMCKSKYDYWDVYWYTDRPYWRRESMAYTRDYKVYPYVEPGEKREGRTLKDIYVESEFLKKRLEEYLTTCPLDEKERVEYLIAHVGGLHTRTACLLGEKMSFNEMTMGIYNLIAPETDFGTIEDVLKELSQALPGEGSLNKKISEFREKIRVPRENLPKTLTAVTEAFHEFAKINMNVSPDNMPRLRFRDLGGQKEFMSILFGYDYNKIEMERNLALDYPYTVDRIMEVIGHEMEPGHLTYFEMRLKTLIDTCYPEMQIIAQYSPSSAFSEGSARRSVYMCFDNDMDKVVNFEKEVIFKNGGLDVELSELMPLWHKYVDLCGYVKLEVTRQRWDGKWTQEEAGKYLEKYFIVPEGQGAKMSDQLAIDDGHFVAHDYARDVMKDYFDATTSSIKEQWDAYETMCRGHMLIPKICDKTFIPKKFPFYGK